MKADEQLDASPGVEPGPPGYEPGVLPHALARETAPVVRYRQTAWTVRGEPHGRSPTSRLPGMGENAARSLGTRPHGCALPAYAPTQHRGVVKRRGVSWE